MHIQSWNYALLAHHYYIDLFCRGNVDTESFFFQNFSTYKFERCLLSTLANMKKAILSNVLSAQNKMISLFIIHSTE